MKARFTEACRRFRGFPMDGFMNDDGQDDDVSGADAADAAPATDSSGDGLPGAPVEGWPGLRAGAFASGQGALGMLDLRGPQAGASIGTPIVAPADGVVVDVRPNPSSSYGHQVVIDHGGGVYTQSAHLSRVDVKPGEPVYAGFPIGLSGDSGNAQGTPQVHFEVRSGSPAPRRAGGNPVDPSGYLPPWCFQ